MAVETQIVDVLFDASLQTNIQNQSTTLESQGYHLVSSFLGPLNPADSSYHVILIFQKP